MSTTHSIPPFPFANIFELELTLFSSVAEERCGEDAKLVIEPDRISIEQPVLFGKMPGTLSTDLVSLGEGEDDLGYPQEADDSTEPRLLRFNVAFRAVDDFEFEPVARGSYCTNLPESLSAGKQLIALTAIHETAKAHLSDGFSRAMALMSQLDPSVIEELLTN